MKARWRGTFDLIGCARGHRLVTAHWNDIALQVADTVDLLSPRLECLALLIKVAMAVIDALDSGTACPSAISAGRGRTPARLMRLRAVRRRSWIIQFGSLAFLSVLRSSASISLSKARLYLEKPPIGRSPSCVNTHPGYPRSSGRRPAARLRPCSAVVRNRSWICGARQGWSIRPPGVHLNLKHKILPGAAFLRLQPV
jgi:hypothetical protein